MAPMRLHLTIRRHNLPPTQILFTYPSPLPGSHTAALPLRTATISHLLRDISTVIPLESEDTNWGLEDYSVEVNGYEALHYQCVDDVLRDGDEVVVRALRTEDLRARRLGGRLQIDEGGRHLVDGVAWGRQMLRSVQRPDFSLPPRKKRRVEEEEREQLTLSNGEEHHGDADEDAEVTSVVRSEQPLRITAGQDFEDADEEDSEEDDFESGSDEEDVSEEDVDSDDLEDAQEESEAVEDDFALISESIPQSDGSSFSTAARKRKRSALEDDDEEDGNTDFNGFSSPVKKPQASLNDVASESELDSGADLDSSSSSESESDSGSESESESEGDDLPVPLRLEKRSAPRNQVDSDETSSSGSDSEERSSNSSSSSDEEEADSSSESSSDISEASHRAIIPRKASRTKSSQSRPALQAMDVNLRITNAKEAEINQTKSAPGEGLQRTRYNNDRSHRRMRLKVLKESGVLPPDANFAVLAAYEKSQETQQVGDSEELADLVAARKKTLSELAEGGDDTSVIQTSGSIAIGTPAKHLQNESPGQVPSVTKSESARTPSQDLFSRDPAAEVPGTSQSEVKPEPVKQRAKLDLNAARNMMFSSLGVRKPKNAEQEQALREKFDRPVKGAHPRTLPKKTEDNREEEATLTEKVSLDKGENDWISKIKLSAVECELEGVELSEPPFPFYQGWDAAANKRFTNKKKKMRNQKQYYQSDGGYDQQYNETYENEGNDEVDWQEPDHEEETYTREAARSQDDKIDQANGVHVDADRQEVLKALDLPRPADIDSLESLQKEAALAGAVIAYKELHVNEHIQPEVSPYRIARIEAVNEDGSLELSLSSQDRTPAMEAIFSEETGERILSRSEMMRAGGEVDIEDDGSRLMTMDDLIEPKLVEKPATSQLGSEIMATVLVNASTGESTGQLPSAQVEAVIPESAPSNMVAIANTTTSEAVLPDSADLGMVAATDTTVSLRGGEINTGGVVNVTTPRRKEITNIIMDAGFNSALDSELMQPIDGAEADDWQPNNGFDDEEALRYDGALNEEDASSPQDDITRLDDRSSSKPTFEESGLSKAVDTDTSGLESPRFNGWTSSPHIEPELQETSSQVAHEDDWLTTQEDPIEAHDNAEEESVTPAKVTYPHISQLEIESATLESSPILNVTQVHHQGEAAEVSADDNPQAIPHHNDDESENNQAVEIEETKMESMKSVVPPSIGSIEERPHPKARLTDAKDSFLGGLDGNDSSGEEDELLSLEHITSTARSQSTQITPPPLPKLRDVTAARKRRSGSGESADFPSQPAFKQSQSQTRLSQIPEGVQVVDLTFSSDPVSPGNSDGDYARTRRVTRRSATAERQSEGRETRSETSKALASSLGLGNRRLLKSRKKT